MGMTDMQFASYQKSLIRDLKRIQSDLLAKGIQDAGLDSLIKELEDDLKKP